MLKWFPYLSARCYSKRCLSLPRFCDVALGGGRSPRAGIDRKNMHAFKATCPCRPALKGHEGRPRCMGLGKVPIQKRRDFKARKRNREERKVPAPFSN